MIGIFVFFVILALLLLALRIIAGKMYIKNNAIIKNEESVSVSDDDINGELIAVIAAAANEILHSQVIVKRIHFIDSHNNSTAWTSAGRLNIMGSHSVK